jgi:class 3 adenylate cyclase/tetratricopeptide (TPR) repeat protein
MSCPRCGADNLPLHRFCSQCGSALRAAVTRFASAQSLTPPHLAEQLRGAPLALEGERKHVTVLFADLKSSMEMLADRDPEEAGKLLDGVLERMLEAVHFHEGTVTQVMGDGVMALFGAPVAHEDHAVRACHAALRMQSAVTQYGDELQRAHGAPVQIRIGLNSGEVLVRAVGHEPTVTYTAVGSAVHLAARMEQMAKPGSTLASADTMWLAQPYIRGRALGRMSVRGVDAPVEVWEILGAGVVRSRLQLSAARGLSRFVGRGAEMEALERALGRADTERGQIVAVVGEAGVGKSRLFHEFARSVRARGSLVLESGSAPHGSPSLHQPGMRMLRQLFRIESSDDARAVLEKVTGKMLTLDRALEPAMPAILALLGGLPVGDAFFALDIAERRQRSLDAMRAILDAERRAQTVVMIVDDLQWADSETRRALNAMADSLPPGTLLLVNYRHDHDDGWRGKVNYTRIGMEPLSPDAAEELLDVLLGTAPSLGPLRRLVTERTEGNPLFLEECVRTLVDSGALVGEPGALRPGRVITSLEVPPTVQALLASRIDRLPPDDKRLLQEAAVIGETVPVALLAVVTDRAEEEVARGLEALRAADFLDAVRGAEPEYVFKHSLTHEVAYETLLHDRRRLLHRRIVEAVQAYGTDRLLPAQAESLAHHAVRAEAWDTAVAHLRRASQAALTRLAPREAVAYLEQALTALAHLPTSRQRQEEAFEVRLELRAALTPLGDQARILGHLREAQGLADTLGDEHRLARVLSFMGQYYINVGESEEAVRAGDRALAVAQRTQDVQLQVIGFATLGAAWRALGDYRAATGHLREVIARVTGPLRPSRFGLAGAAAVLSRGHLAWSLAEMGEFTEAVAVGREAMQLAAEVGDAYSICHGALGLGGTLVRQGRFDEAIRVIERGIALGDQVPLLFPPLAADLGLAHARAGRTEKGVELATQAVERATAMGRLGRLALLIAHLGEIHLLAGDLDAARERATMALDLARAKKERGNQVYGLLLHGEIGTRTPQPEVSTREHLEQGLRLATELAMRPLAGRCQLALGLLARREGRDAEAAHHLGVAAATFGALDMTYWAEAAREAGRSRVSRDSV